MHDMLKCSPFRCGLCGGDGGRGGGMARVPHVLVDGMYLLEIIYLSLTIGSVKLL